MKIFPLMNAGRAVISVQVYCIACWAPRTVWGGRLTQPSSLPFLYLLNPLFAKIDGNWNKIHCLGQRSGQGGGGRGGTGNVQIKLTDMYRRNYLLFSTCQICTTDTEYCLIPDRHVLQTLYIV